MSRRPKQPVLVEFDARLQAARAAHESGEQKTTPSTTSRDLGLAYRVAIEMATGLAVGAGLGWLLDSWLGTRPFLLVAMVLMGFAAGILNALRVSRQVTAAAERQEREAQAQATRDRHSDAQRPDER